MNSDFEVILVNDGSPDNDWAEICSIAKNDNRIRGISLSRNFGQHNAIFAGLNQAKNEWVVVMDCDLQDMPEEIEKLYNKAQEGYDVVFAQRINRKDNFSRKFLSMAFYGVLNYLAEIQLDRTVANFGVYHNKVIRSICSTKDKTLYFPALVKWTGFKSASIPVNHSERLFGKTSYSFRRLFKLGANVIIAYSEKPLKLVVQFGLYISGISLILILYNLYKYFRGAVGVLGWESLMLSLWFLGGMVIFILGIIGLYLGRIFQNSNDRPVFIIDKVTN